jgi:hypothetical protein
MSDPWRPFRRLEQQRTAPGVAAEVKDRDPVTVPRVQEHIEHLSGRGVGALDDLAEAGLFRGDHGLAHPAMLFGEVAQVER